MAATWGTLPREHRHSRASQETTTRNPTFRIEECLVTALLNFSGKEYFLTPTLTARGDAWLKVRARQELKT